MPSARKTIKVKNVRVENPEYSTAWFVYCLVVASLAELLAVLDII